MQCSLCEPPLLTRASPAQGLEAVLPAASYSSSTPRSLFEDEAWTEAYAADPHLKALRMYDERDERVDSAERAIEARWTSMSDAELQRYEDTIRAGKQAHDAYVTSQCVSAVHKAPLLHALLRRASGVHTLNMGDVLYGPAHTVAFDSSILRDVGTTWGASLRFVRLAGKKLGAVTAADIHMLLAACPQLALLDIGYLHLDACKCCGADPADALFHTGMTPHAELRAVALPAAPQHLQRFVERLVKRCPALREINAESFSTHEQDDADEHYFGNYRNSRCEAVATSAKLAARHGVTRFLCSSFFDEGGSDGEYGSDGGSVGEYCGDGNVLKYLSR